MTVPSITEFLLARIEELEDIHTDPEQLFNRWHVFDCDFVTYSWAGGLGGSDCNCGVPARVLAECAMKRMVIRDYLHLKDNYQRAYLGDAVTRSEGAIRNYEGIIDEWALLYSDHPDCPLTPPPARDTG